MLKPFEDFNTVVLHRGFQHKAHYRLGKQPRALFYWLLFKCICMVCVCICVGDIPRFRCICVHVHVETWDWHWESSSGHFTHYSSRQNLSWIQSARIWLVCHSTCVEIPSLPSEGWNPRWVTTLTWHLRVCCRAELQSSQVHSNYFTHQVTSPCSY